MRGPGLRGGAVSLELAGPTGSVVGLDVDQAKLNLARQAARERGLGNVVFEAGDVNAWGAPGEYDLVYRRFLLRHLARPAGLASAWSTSGPIN